MLTSPGRRLRAALTLVVMALTLIGSVRYEDEAFPFGPFSMFASRTEPDGHVNVAQLRARVAGSPDEKPISMASFGLRRGEVEGQMSRLHADPSLLGELAKARDGLRPDLPQVTELRLVQIQYLLENGRKTGYREETVAAWRR